MKKILFIFLFFCVSVVSATEYNHTSEHVQAFRQMLEKEVNRTIRRNVYDLKRAMNGFRAYEETKLIAQSRVFDDKECIIHGKQFPSCDLLDRTIPEMYSKKINRECDSCEEVSRLCFGHDESKSLHDEVLSRAPAFSGIALFIALLVCRKLYFDNGIACGVFILYWIALWAEVYNYIEGVYDSILLAPALVINSYLLLDVSFHILLNKCK